MSQYPFNYSISLSKVQEMKNMRICLFQSFRTYATSNHVSSKKGLIEVKISFAADDAPAAGNSTTMFIECYRAYLTYICASLTGVAKLTISYDVLMPNSSNLSFTLGSAIYVSDEEGLITNSFLPELYSLLSDKIRTPDSGMAKVVAIYMRVYVENLLEIVEPFAFMSKQQIEESIERLQSDLPQNLKVDVTPASVSIKVVRKRYGCNKTHHQIMSKLKEYSLKERAGFFVADFETVLNDKGEHIPYAAGVMKVLPHATVEEQDHIMCWFSEDNYNLETFEERSRDGVLKRFIRFLATIIEKNQTVKTIYFHNFARFDGILLVKHLAINNPEFKLKPLMRNGQLYELVVYLGKRKRMIFRDSLKLLPGSLDSLASSLCPELGKKGEIDHSTVSLHNLGERKDELVSYMKQDIRLLAGIMLKAQDLYWGLYRVDVVDKITLSSLSLSIFRKVFYNPNLTPIAIPTGNEDTFVRRGYYGGHVDVYKPRGENLYYYDVNSLYPYVMKTFSMPIGKPIWSPDLSSSNIEDLFGFIEAYVICPEHIKNPVLPYRDSKETLSFPTGQFMGVYYSEELKYAKSIGYTVIPIKGYLYEKGEGLFHSFVDELYGNRLKAKKDGNTALAYIYKIFLNSLYGRFGINPRSTITEICNFEEYKRILKIDGFQHAEPLSDDLFICSYITDIYQNYQKRNAAVQIAAAITACARVYMHPFINREDCYYTDTDSLVLSQPLPEEMISKEELGKFKMEYRVKEAIFLAPKSYWLNLDQQDDILTHKGATKSHVSKEWFLSQYEDPSITQKVEVTNPFKVNLKTFTVKKQQSEFTLALPDSNKRIKVNDSQGQWVDTKPFHLDAVPGIDSSIQILIDSLLNKISDLQGSKKKKPALQASEKKTPAQQGSKKKKPAQQGSKKKTPSQQGSKKKTPAPQSSDKEKKKTPQLNLVKEQREQKKKKQLKRGTGKKPPN